MNNKLISVLAILSATTLVACAGGGDKTTASSGGASVVVGGTTTGGTTTKPTQPTKIDPTIQGNIITLNPANDRVARQNFSTTQTTSINKVVVNGQTIDFLPSSSENARNISVKGRNMVRVGSGTELSYMRYGYMKNGENATPYVFAQGQVTTDDMPKTGIFKYQGHATHVENGEISRASANFDVDYAQKTLVGTITPTSGGSIVLNATIDGNRFQGNNRTMITNGYFYGSKAEELGGTYQNNIGNINGAFGAVKK